MPTHSTKPNAAEWISKSEAARLRGVSRQAIWELVKRGRLRPSTINGRAYLKRAEVMSFKYGKRGPYSRIPAAELITRLNLKKKYAPSQWLSVSEAASTLGITHPAVAELVKRRRLKAAVIEERTLIARSGVQKLKTRQRGAKRKS